MYMLFHVWIATLTLTKDDNDEYISNFSFKKEDRKYKELTTNGNKYYEYNEWAKYRLIPQRMSLDELGYYSKNTKYAIIQGFNHELNEKALQELEIEMRTALKKYIKDDAEKRIEAL